MYTTCSSCPNRSVCFNDMSMNELTKVTEHKSEITYKKGETIIKQNTAAKHIYFVKSGLVKVHIENEDKNLILEVSGKSSMLGVTALNHSKKYNFSVTAIETVEVCEINIDVISNIMTNNVAFSLSIINELNISIDKLLSKVFYLSHKNIQSRMAELLLNFSDKIFESKTFILPISRTELAELTNMAKENVVRTLKDFESKGYIKSKGRQVEIIDYKSLSEISQ